MDVEAAHIEVVDVNEVDFMRRDRIEKIQAGELSDEALTDEEQHEEVKQVSSQFPPSYADADRIDGFVLDRRDFRSFDTKTLDCPYCHVSFAHHWNIKIHVNTTHELTKFFKYGKFKSTC